MALIEYAEDTEWKAIITTVDGSEYIVKSGIHDRDIAYDIAVVSEHVYMKGLTDAKEEILSRLADIDF